jgi:hypothetical protein
VIDFSEDDDNGILDALPCAVMPADFFYNG